MRRRHAAVAAATVAAALAASPAPALANQRTENLPWPQLLPPVPVTTKVQPHGVPHCRRASVGCMDDLLRRLHRQWRRLNAACDHRALFSLAYIRITQGLRDDIARRPPKLIRYRRWMVDVIIDFSNHYFQYFNAYAQHRPVPDAWKIAYDDAMHGDTNGGQDVLLASSAHTQHDLPYIYAAMGMRTPGGASRKPDHDAVNAINAGVFVGLEHYYAQHYDPLFTTIMKSSPLDQIGTLETVKGWREGAWRNAERLLNARTAAERHQVEQSIDIDSRVWAEAMSSVTQPGYRATRDAYCRAHHERT